jgi:vacuolar-type H+-ATPase subunit I/STV1
MARKLKVFCYSDGFHSWTVAAPSRAKALEAWGVKRDLFRDGAAREIQIGPDREAALAAPGELIERGLAVDIGEVARKTASKAKPKPEQPKSDAKARARLEALEADLAALDEAQAAEASALGAEREALERKAEALAKRQAKAREALKTKLKAARAKLSG